MGQGAGAGERLDQDPQRLDRADLPRTGHARLAHRSARHHPVGLGADADHRRDAGHPADRSVEPQLAGERRSLHGVGRHDAGGDEDADRDRHVEP